MKVTYQVTTDKKIPAVVYKGDYSTLVWIQSEWTEGRYAGWVQRNGCGHCCTAMAANLRGKSLDPHQELTLCCELWGEPSDANQTAPFITVAGIVKVLEHLGLSSACFGVAKGEAKQATEHIIKSLQNGKLVIFISDPERYPENPFSTGLHYVMAVGIDEKGDILIANSSEKVSKGGIQKVAAQTIEKSIFEGGTANPEMTWGMLDYIPRGCTYVVVD